MELVRRHPVHSRARERPHARACVRRHGCQPGSRWRESEVRRRTVASLHRRQRAFSLSTPSEIEGFVYVGSLDSATATPLVATEWGAQISQGFLLFLKGTTLMAQPFGPGDKLTGDAVPASEERCRWLRRVPGLFHVHDRHPGLRESGARRSRIAMVQPRRTALDGWRRPPTTSTSVSRLMRRASRIPASIPSHRRPTCG